MYFRRHSACRILLFALCLLLSPYCLLPAATHAADEPFTYPSNRGGTGLMEIPTARVINEESYRLGFSQIKPYRYYYGVISPVKGFEIAGRITEVIGVPGFDQSYSNSYGSYKDKAFDLKYLFFHEGKYMPALAIGFMDPHGTRIYSSQYIVASRQIYPFDFTLGFGNGRFGKTPLPEQGEGIELEMFSDTKKWLRDSQVFWGVQFVPSDKFALMFEYSPIKYHEQTGDPAQDKYFKGPVPSKYNLGLRYKPAKWSEFDLTYQRGNEIGFNVSMAFDIGKPLIPIYDPPYKENQARRKNPLYERITTALYYSGFSDIWVAAKGDALWIEAENDRYYYSTKAIGVILKTIVEMIPENIEKIYITLKENGIPKIEFNTIKSDINDLYAGNLTLNEFYYLAGIGTDVSKISGVQGRYKKKFKYGIKPSLETFLNDPSGFFKYRFGLSGWASYNPWSGATVFTGLEGYPLNNISTVNEPLSIPVRSDIVLYKKEKVGMGRLLFDQIQKTGHELYGKISAGYLEVQYAGLDAEIAKPFFDGRILSGLSGSIVKKRDPDNPFKFKADDVKDFYTTAFINTRLNIPEIDIAVDVKAGRFLAGDNGARFSVSKFINGVVLKVWYTITDTSDFTDEFNKGYNDKGFSVSIPIRLFTGADSKTVFHYSLTPWTRDTGQDIDHFGTLFDFIGRDVKILIDKERKMRYR